MKIVELFKGNILLKTEEVAPVLGVKPCTIVAWVNKGKIPFVKFGEGKKAPVRFLPRDLNKWIYQNSRKTESREQRLNPVKKKRRSKMACKKTIDEFANFAESIMQKEG